MGRLNKPAQEGYNYRSPGQTNANDRLPNLREDVVRSQAADAGRIKRGLDTAEIANAANRRRAQEAGGRALTRTAGRAAGAASALSAGYELGRAIDEQTGIGRKMVDKAVGPAIDQMVSGGTGERVKLSPQSKARIAAGEADREPAEASYDETERLVKRGTSQPAAKKSSAKRAPSEAPTGGVREGRNANIDDDVRSRAMASVEDSEESYAKGGKVRGWGIARGGRSAKMR